MGRDRKVHREGLPEPQLKGRRLLRVGYRVFRGSGRPWNRRVRRRDRTKGRRDRRRHDSGDRDRHRQRLRTHFDLRV